MTLACMRRLLNNAESDSEHQDETTPQLGFGPDKHRLQFRVGATIILLGIVLLVVATLLIPTHDPTGIPKSEERTRYPLRSTWSPTAAQLIESRELSEAVGQLAACSVEEGTKLQKSAGADVEQELPSQWRKQLKFAVDNHYHATIRELNSAHPELHKILSETRLTPSQTSAVLEVLRSLTDRRVLAIGVKVGRSCTKSTREEFEHCALRNLAPFAAQVRKLREEVLPTSLRVLSDKLKVRHLHVLRQRGFFHISGDTDGWHAEASVKDHRILQESSSSKKPQISTSLLYFQSGNPQISTSLLNVPAWSRPITLAAAISHVQTSSPLPGRSTLAQPRPGAQGFAPSITPVNWFTVGAPAVSTVIGLLSLCLMALLPGTGGFPVNRAANYGLWGLQGAATVGECLANIGFPHGVVYFASCIIDVMFLGLEVIWVFFDGRAVSGPQRITSCSSYAAWANITGACGNCMATTNSSLGADNCNSYCGSFGHHCKFAAVAVADSCFPMGTYSCGERIPAGSRMLCQCSSVRRLQMEPSKKDHAISKNVQHAWSQTVDASVPQPKLAEGLPEGPAAQERRLQGIWVISGPGNSAQLNPSPCIHAETFLIITVSNQTSSSSSIAPMVNFLVAGVWTDPVPVFTMPTVVGENVTTRLLLAQQPTQMQLVADRSVSNHWGYKRIVLQTSRAVATILDSANGVPLGNNDFWIGTAPARDRQIFDIPATFNSTLTVASLLELRRARGIAAEQLSRRYQEGLRELIVFRARNSITTTTTIQPTTMTTTSGAASATYYLEVQTPRRRQGSTGSGVLVQFLLGGEWTAPMEFAPGLDLNAQGQGILGGDCVGRNFSLPMRPTEVRLIDNPVDPDLNFPWVYSRVVLVEGPNLLLTVLADQEPPLRTDAAQLQFHEVRGVNTQTYLVSLAPTQTSTTTTATTTTATTTSSTTTTATQGSQSPPRGPIRCSAYVAWPNITGDVCGACRALVPTQCSDYCQGFNHVCLHAALPGPGFCQQSASVNCDRRPATPTANMLCTCGVSNGVEGPQPRCNPYSQWPSIGLEICGNCQAVVQVQPASSTTSSCQSFCHSHGHNCESAAVRSSNRTTPCTEERPLGCFDSTAGLDDFLCTCVNV